MVVTNCFKRRVTNRPLTLKSIPCLLVVLLLFSTHISAFDWQRIMDIFHHYGFNGTVPGEGPSMTDMFGKVQGVLKDDPELWAWLMSKAQELKAKKQSPFDAGLDLFKEFQSFMKERNAKDAQRTTSRMEAKQNEREYYATRGPGPNVFYMYHNTMDGDKKYQYEHEVHGYHEDGETNYEETIKTNGEENQNQYHYPGTTQSYYNPNNNQPNVPPGGGYHQQGYRSERYDFTKDNTHPQAHGPNVNTGGYGYPPNNGPYYANSYNTNPNGNQYRPQDHNQGYTPNQNNYNSYNKEQNTQQPPQYHNQGYRPNQDNYNSYNNEQNTQPPQYHNQGYRPNQNNYNSYNKEQNTQQPPQYHNQGYRPNQDNYNSYNDGQNTQHTTQDHNQNYRPNQNNYNNEQNTHRFHYEQPHQTGNNQHKYGNNNQYSGYGYEITTNPPPPTPKPFMPRFWDFFKNIKK